MITVFGLGIADGDWHASTFTHQLPNIMANEEMANGRTSTQRVATALMPHSRRTAPRYAASAARQPAAALHGGQNHVGGCTVAPMTSTYTLRSNRLLKHLSIGIYLWNNTTTNVYFLVEGTPLLDEVYPEIYPLLKGWRLYRYYNLHFSCQPSPSHP